METLREDDIPPPDNPVLEAIKLRKQYENSGLTAITPDGLAILHNLTRLVGSMGLESTMQINA